MKRIKMNSIKSIALALALCLACLTACGQASAPAASNAGAALPSGGVLFLKVNPAIAVSYNNEGLVTDVTARNADGSKILESYTGFEGKQTRQVVGELVTAIGQAGYFVEEVEGESRTITIEIERGSKVPTETFLDDVVAEVQTTVASNDWTSPVTATDNSGQTPAPQTPVPQNTPTGAVIDPNGNVSFTGGTNYDDTDYGPNNDGVTDYNDTDYGPNNDGVTDYNDTDYGPNNDGVTDYNDTDYGPNNDGVTDYNDTDYGPNNDGVTDYNDTDYGPNNDGVTDYNDTDYGPNNDGVTDYNDTDYGPNNDGVTDYSSGNSNYGNSNYSSGNSNYGNSGYDD